MATVLRPDLATLDQAFKDVVAVLPPVTRIVAVHSGSEPTYVVTVDGDWVAEVPAIHRAVRPLRQRDDLSFDYRTIRQSWCEPDPTPSHLLYARP
jgi:hypothetical protein